MLKASFASILGEHRSTGSSQMVGVRDTQWSSLTPMR
jgi:hypothetical protein